MCTPRRNPTVSVFEAAARSKAPAAFATASGMAAFSLGALLGAGDHLVTRSLLRLSSVSCCSEILRWGGPSSSTIAIRSRRFRYAGRVLQTPSNRQSLVDIAAVTEAALCRG